MKSARRQSIRRHSATLPSTIALAAAMALVSVSVARAADKSWIAGNGNWNTPGNWTPAGVPPQWANIYIGNMPGVQNSTVTMGGALVTVQFDYLELSDGMTLDLNGSELLSFGAADITGAGTHLIARPASPINVLDFWAFDTYIGPGAHVELVDNVPIELGYQGANQGLISGRGSARMGVDFSNDGVIKPGGNGGLLLYAGPGATGWVMNLDGTSGDGHLQLDTPFSQLLVEFGSLTDSFSGTITMTHGALLTMDIEDGWTADAGAEFNILGTNNPNSASQINGDVLTFGGALNVGANQAHLRLLADCNLQTNPAVNVAANGWLEFDGETTVAGGQFTLGQAAQLDFDDATWLHGGTFTTPTTNIANGVVDFNGPTVWDGTVNINGVARQNSGTAWVTDGTTAINAPAGTFDLDGVSGATHWEVGANFTVNASRINTSAASPYQFDGDFNIHNGLVPRLTVNLTNPAASWYMTGHMLMSGQTQLYETRVAGSPMIVTGVLDHIVGRVNITADTTFSTPADPALVNISVADAVLRMYADSFVGSQTTFWGLGTLQNGPNGAMTLDDGVLLNNVGLVNQGHLFIRRANVPDLAGLVSVDRFTNENGANWQVRIGGYTLGQDHDHVVVTDGSATLNGTLDVSLFDANGVPFNPQIGDEFTILTAVGGVGGNIVVNPTACIDGNSYYWTVLYGPNDVRVRLDSITGMPGDMNCDCRVNGLDVQPFVYALLDPAAHAAAYADCDIMHGDVNADGNVDIDDVSPFAQLLVAMP